MLKNSPYADDTFYNGEYLQGRTAVITSGLSFYLQKSTNIINKYIGTVITDVTDEVRMCCCEIADLLFSETLRDNKTSETTTVIQLHGIYQKHQKKRSYLS